MKKSILVFCLILIASTVRAQWTDLYPFTITLANNDTGTVNYLTWHLSRNTTGPLGWYWPASNGTSGQVLTTNGASPAILSWANASGGTVTSVGLALPASLFTVTGSPVTTSGTLTGTLTTQTANTVFAGPTSGGAAAPTFRALVAADIPLLSGYVQLTPGAAQTILPSADVVPLALQAFSSTSETHFLDFLTQPGSPSIVAYVGDEGEFQTNGGIILGAAATITDKNGSVGSAGQLLESSGAGIGPVWTTAPSPGMANPMGALGDMIFENATPAPAALSGNTSTTKEYLSQTGTGSVSAAPVWAQVNYSDLAGSDPVSAGSGNYIQNQNVARQTAEYEIRNASTDTVAHIINATATGFISEHAIALDLESTGAGTAGANYGLDFNVANGNANFDIFGTSGNWYVKSSGDERLGGGLIVTNTLDLSSGTAPIIDGLGTAGTTGQVLESIGAGSSPRWTTFSGMSNPMTTLGDIIYEDATPTAVRLAGQTTTTKEFLSQTGTGSISAAPVWAQPAFSDLSGSLTSAQLPSGWNPVAIAHGGTGLTGTPTDGQLLIGSTSGSDYVLSTLTAGSGVSITNSSGGITIAATGSGGTVTSISNSDGSLTPSPNPITSTGTLSLNVAHANTWTGIQTLEQNTQGAADAQALVLDNNAAATSGGQQFPPGIASQGHYWNGSASTAVFGYEGMEISPISGTATSKSYVWRIGGVSPPIQATLSDGGVFSPVTGFQINGASAATHHYLRGNGTNYVDGTIVLGDLPLTGASTGSAIMDIGGSVAYQQSLIVIHGTNYTMGAAFGPGTSTAIITIPASASNHFVPLAVHVVTVSITGTPAVGTLEIGDVITANSICVAQTPTNTANTRQVFAVNNPGNIFGTAGAVSIYAESASATTGGTVTVEVDLIGFYDPF